MLDNLTTTIPLKVFITIFVFSGSRAFERPPLKIDYLYFGKFNPLRAIINGFFSNYSKTKHIFVPL